jgi:hypothetical protein
MMKIQIAVFWVVAPHSVAKGYQRFEGFAALHFQDDVTSSTRRFPGLSPLQMCPFF